VNRNVESTRITRTKQNEFASEPGALSRRSPGIATQLGYRQVRDATFYEGDDPTCTPHVIIGGQPGSTLFANQPETFTSFGTKILLTPW
jgi:hypothetical protein